MAEPVYFIELDEAKGAWRLVSDDGESRSVVAWEYPDGPRSVPEDVFPVLRAVYVQPAVDVLRVARALHAVGACRSCHGTAQSPSQIDRDNAVAALSAIRDGGGDG